MIVFFIEDDIKISNVISLSAKDNSDNVYHLYLWMN